MKSKSNTRYTVAFIFSSSSIRVPWWMYSDEFFLIITLDLQFLTSFCHIGVTVKPAPNWLLFLTFLTLVWHNCDRFCVTGVTQLSHYCDTAVTILPHSCHNSDTGVTQLWHYCNTIVTIVPHSCHSSATLPSQYCDRNVGLNFPRSD